MSIKAPRGTQDIIPSKIHDWQFLRNLLIEICTSYGFKEIRTPIFEHIELFLRGVGGTTDVVQKEIFEVKAQKGSDIFALKPEGTAGVVRAALEHGLLSDALPLKVCYITPCFRHERPQAGRLREFYQFGCEMFGSSNPNSDIEIVSMMTHIINMLSIKNVILYINSIGCRECRPKYHVLLKDFFENKKSELCSICNDRLITNPMRILDCKNPSCIAIAKDAPIILNSLCDECDNHFNEFKHGLTACNIPYEINTKIVRGLDYYTKTVFEFVCNDLAAQSTLCGGGRYDNLVNELGSKDIPALGFAIGIERLLMILDKQNIKIGSPKTCELYIANIGELAGIKALQMSLKLRAEGFYVEFDNMNRSLKSQLKYADKISAKFSIVLGDNELNTKKATIKNMYNGTSEEIFYEKELLDILYNEMLKMQAESLSEHIDKDAFQKIMEIKK